MPCLNFRRTELGAIRRQEVQQNGKLSRDPDRLQFANGLAANNALLWRA